MRRDDWLLICLATPPLLSQCVQLRLVIIFTLAEFGGARSMAVEPKRIYGWTPSGFVKVCRKIVAQEVPLELKKATDGQIRRSDRIGWPEPHPL